MSRIGVWFLKRWPSLVGALAFLLAYAPFNLWPLMFLTLAPMLHQLRKADSKEAWRIGYLFGFTLFLGQMFWLYCLANHWIHRPFLSLIPWIITAVLEGLFFGWVARLARHCWLRGWPILIPVAWAGMEVARSYFPVVALPWGLVATPLYKAPVLIQNAHFGTIYFVSAWVVLGNVILAMAMDREKRDKLRPLIAVFFFLLVLSAFQMDLSPASRPFTVTVGQPGVDMAFGDRNTRADDIASNVDRISDQAVRNHSQLLVLPEGIALDSHNPPRPPFVIDKSLPVFFGGQRDEGKLTYQTAYGYDGTWHYADKTRLVIFGEFVPGRASMPWIAKTFDLPSDDLSASTKGVLSVDVAGTRVGPMLCFEALFPDVSFQQAKNGAQFISVMCIDDWYMGTPAPDQLKAASIFRAVETGLPLVRSASLGTTLAVDGHGRSLGELPIGHPAGLNVTLQLPQNRTYFPFLQLFPAVALLFAVVLPWLPKRREPEPPKESA